MAALALVDVRPKLLAVLAPIADDDPNVVDVVDSISPPTYMIGWGQPWLTPMTVGGCNWSTRIIVLSVAGRIDPTSGMDRLENMVTSALARLSGDADRWPVEAVNVPERVEIGGVSYLAARITLTPVVTT